MEKKSRIQNAVTNVGAAGIIQVITIVLNFISRTIFIKMLGNDYLSCDGLFTNILTVLSFSELGVGSAIIFSLYKPIADDDKVQIGKLMNLFAVAYRYIALTIGILGICVIPFLKYLIKDVPDVRESIFLLYVLFLMNTVSSYIFGYKRSFLIANQENYIVLFIQQGVNVVKIVVQFLALLYTHNYILYLILNIVATLVVNIVSTGLTDKKYKWLKAYQKNKLLKEERKPIFSNIFSIFQYKLGSVILNGTDNIIISVVLKTSFVGLVSNYNMIISAIQSIVNQACGGLQATVGNYNAISDKENKYKIFCKLNFISNWVFGFFTICFAVLINPFIEDVWVGKDFLLPYDVVIALSLSMYISFINTIPSTYRTTMGYFKEARRCPIYASILNIFLSVVLAKTIGLSGIFFATAISRFLTFNMVDPYYVFKKGFGLNVLKFHAQFALNFLVLILNYAVTFYCVHLIGIRGFGGFIIKAVIACVICNLLFFAVYFKTTIFSETLHTLKAFIKRKQGSDKN